MASRHKSDLSAQVATLVRHPAAPLLNHHHKQGAPVTMQTQPWSQERRAAAMHRGPHCSALDHIEFLREEFTAMIQKGHWTLLPARLVQQLPNLRLSPIGVVPQRDQQPRTIVDYTFFDVNEDTAALAPREAMQFGRRLSGPNLVIKIDQI
jgi:hypothetical protein